MATPRLLPRLLDALAAPGLLLALALVPACNGDGDDGGTSLDASFRTGYLASDPCRLHTEESACGSATGEGCQWRTLAAECPAGTTCPAGFCEQADPCRDHAGQDPCLADEGHQCAWANRERLCLGNHDCRDAGGFCFQEHQGALDCACLCPMYCAPGEDCACECDCNMHRAREQERNRGGTCTCACPPCAEGTTCEPCECACEGTNGPGEGGCVDGGTCLCQCEQCDDPPCAECDCACNLYESPGPHGAATPTCTCPSCPDGNDCEACNCWGDGGGTGGDTGGTGGTGGDPGTGCGDHVQAMDCSADMDCLWLKLGDMCGGDGSCRAGTCVAADAAPDGCLCLCEECDGGDACTQCGCDCSANTNCAPA